MSEFVGCLKSVAAGVFTLVLFVGVGYFVYTSLFVTDTPDTISNFATLPHQTEYVCSVADRITEKGDIGQVAVAHTHNGCGDGEQMAYTAESSIAPHQDVVVVDHYGNRWAVTPGYFARRQKGRAPGQ